jgi:hypothetical protein
MLIIVCKIVKYGTKMEIKNLTTTTTILHISLHYRYVPQYISMANLTIFVYQKGFATCTG